MAGIEHKLRGIRADRARRGCSFEYRIDPPGQVWRDFVHDTGEIGILVAGEIEIPTTTNFFNDRSQHGQRR